MRTMFDNVDATSIPADAWSCGGYTDGHWPDAGPMIRRFPHLAMLGRVLTITTQGGKARCLDIENGNPTPPSHAPVWVRQMHAAKIWMPVIYAGRLTSMPACRQALDRAGLIQNRDYLLWVADYTDHPHIPPGGFNACQWTDHAGPNDESLTENAFWPSVSPPLPSGIANAGLHFDPVKGEWIVVGLPGTVKLGGQDRQASVEVQLNESTYRWRSHPLPYDAPPLGK